MSYTFGEMNRKGADDDFQDDDDDDDGVECLL